MNSNLYSIFLFSGPSLLSGVFLVMAFILVLLTIIGIFYLYFTSKSKERLALIEKGMDPNLANSDFLTQVGIIGGGFTLGLIAGDRLPGGYGPLIGVVFAAISILAYTVIKRNKALKNAAKNNQKTSTD